MFIKKKDKISGTLKQDGRGKHGKHSKVTDEQRNDIMNHINSFPVMESHYCRAKTNKKYLQSDLKIEKMYDLYKVKCAEVEKVPVKSAYYRYIFNTCFNIDFHIPKTDRCEKCEEIKIKEKENITISHDEKNIHDVHIGEKLVMREEKNRDKSIDDDKSLMVVFDLENVITLPKAEVGSFFYKRKLNLYNLTAMTSKKQGYCALWTECMSGRAGNDIASAFIQIISKAAQDHPNVKELVCWSDSCVPQNRNSHISQAILEYLDRQNQITMITMKYSIAGQSCVKEVDNMHQQIEVAMRVSEFYSPVSFLRILLKVNRSRPYRVIQMSSDDFKDFQNSSKMLKYSEVPYTKVLQLRFTKDNPNPHAVRYKLSHSDSDFQVACIGKKGRQSRKSSNTHPVQVAETDSKMLISRKQRSHKELPQLKMADLKSMLNLMPIVDRQYYNSLGIN